MEFDRYGRIRNPNITSTEPVDTYTHVTNSRSSSTFFLWDWFNDMIIGIGNFIANSTEYIIAGLTWIVLLAGGIFAVTSLIEVWTKNNFIVAAIITFFGGGLLYYVFMIMLGILYWIVSVSLAILRYIFYNAYTLLLVVGICVGVVWYSNRNASIASNYEPTTRSYAIETTHRYRCTANTLNVRREPYTGSLVIGKLHKGDFVEVYDVHDSFAYIKYGDTKAWASIKYLEKMY